MKTSKSDKKRIIEAVLESVSSGVSMAKGCKAAGIDFSTFWRWRKESKELDKKVIDIIEGRTQVVEDALFASALKGNVTAQIFWLKNRAPDRWKDRYEGEVGGEVKLKPLRVIIRNSGKNDK